MFDNNYYIIKQSNGSIWKFFFKKNKGIVYKIFKNNVWSKSSVLSSTASKNFSVILFSDNKINVLYKNLNGSIIISKYSNRKWIDEELIKNSEDNLYVNYFKTIIEDTKIHIVFSVLDKKNDSITLFHQLLYQDNTLSDPKIIDVIDSSYKIPFNIAKSDTNKLFIIYQKLTDNYKLGYKVLDPLTKEFSNFNLIDNNIHPFIDYSIMMINNILHGIYIKKQVDIDNLIYIRNYGSKFIKLSLLENKSIQSCLFFMACGQIHTLALANNIIYNNISIDNGNTFTDPPYNHPIKFSNLYKISYISNIAKEKDSLCVNELFVSNSSNLNNLLLHNILTNFENITQNDYMHYMEYYINSLHSNCVYNNNKVETQELLIFDLKTQIEQEKSKTLFYQKKFNDLNEVYLKFIPLRDELKKNVKLLQESLITKETELDSLKSSNIDMENQIQLLESINSEDKNTILSLENTISKNEKAILYLIKEIKDLKFKIKVIYFTLKKKYNLE